MLCPTCGEENPQVARFCIGCGLALAATCAACGEQNPPVSRFCMSCGGPLSSPRRAGGSAPPQDVSPGVSRGLPVLASTNQLAAAGERKQITALFCDLVNSVAITERLGSEDFVSLLNRFLELALAEVQRYGGMIDNFRGDGFLALFGAPVAHEDHARRAVLAALGIRRQLEEHRGTFSEPHDVELAVRMGLNTGPVVVGHIGGDLAMDYTAIGDTTNVAARLQQLAEPGTILLSEATARPVTGYAHVEAIGPIEVRGRSAQIVAYKLLGIGPRRSPLEGLAPRTLSRFVGRSRQVGELQALFEQVEQGRGQAVGIAGEPGMGKSRLVYEFRRTLERQRVTYLEGRCLSYGATTPYLPILDVIRNNCGVSEGDTVEIIGEKIRFALQEVDMDPAEWAPYVLHLFGVKEGDGVDQLALLSPEAVKARTFEALRQMALRGSRLRPIVFVVEDLHWIDKTSEEYLAALVESFAGSRIMLLTTYRPRYVAPWMDQSYSTQIGLQRLAPGEALSIVRSVLHAEQVPEPLADTILSKADGNPFFLEELAKAVAEHDDFRAEIAVPDTVQGVLAARMDRLTEGPRRVLQTASILGREFSLRLLGAIWDGPGVLEPHLLELKRLEFVYELTGSEEPIYAFKHALTQDVAYESLLVTHRQALHAATGRALEMLYADHLEDVYDRLAYHYSRTLDSAKAVEYLIRFADRAAQSYANMDAARTLEEALAHVERLPVEQQDRSLLTIVIRLAHSLYFLGRFGQTLTLLLQQQSRVERIQDPGVAGPYYFWLAHTYNHLGKHQLAAENAAKAIEAAGRCGDVATMGKAHYLLAREGVFSAQFRKGFEHGRQAVSLLERTDERLWLSQSHCFVGINACFMGDLDEALDAAERGRTIGVATGDARTESYATWNRGWFLAARGDCDAGIEACQHALQRSPDPFNSAAAMGWLGYAYLEKGDAAQAIPALEHSLQQWRQFAHGTLIGWFSAWLSEAYLLAGRVEEASSLAREGLTSSEAASNWAGVGFSERALGRIALVTGARSEAKQYFERACRTFDSIQARLEVGRTHLLLAEAAHVAHDQGQVADHLSMSFALFTALRIPRYVERVEQLAQAYGTRPQQEPESRSARTA